MPNRKTDWIALAKQNPNLFTFDAFGRIAQPSVDVITKIRYLEKVGYTVPNSNANITTIDTNQGVKGMQIKLDIPELKRIAIGTATLLEYYLEPLIKTNPNLCLYDASGKEVSANELRTQNKNFAGSINDYLDAIQKKSQPALNNFFTELLNLREYCKDLDLGFTRTKWEKEGKNTYNNAISELNEAQARIDAYKKLGKYEKQYYDNSYLEYDKKHHNATNTLSGLIPFQRSLHDQRIDEHMENTFSRQNQYNTTTKYVGTLTRQQNVQPQGATGFPQQTQSVTNNPFDRNFGTTPTQQNPQQSTFVQKFTSQATPNTNMNVQSVQSTPKQQDKVIDAYVMTGDGDLQIKLKIIPLKGNQAMLNAYCNKEHFNKLTKHKDDRLVCTTYTGGAAIGKGERLKQTFQIFYNTPFKCNNSVTLSQCNLYSPNNKMENNIILKTNDTIDLQSKEGQKLQDNSKHNYFSNMNIKPLSQATLEFFKNELNTGQSQSMVK